MLQLIAVLLLSQVAAPPPVDSAALAGAITTALEAHEAKHADSDNKEALRWAIVTGLGGLIGLVTWFGRGRLENIEKGIAAASASSQKHEFEIGKLDLRTTSLEGWRREREEQHQRANEEHVDRLRKELAEKQRLLEEAKGKAG